MTDKTIAAGLALVLSATMAGHAQELTPLGQAIKDGAEESYPLVRCGALYVSSLEWIGADRLGADRTAEIQTVVGGIIATATNMRRGALGEDAEASVTSEIEEISRMYLRRYQANLDTHGTAFQDDPVWADDSAICATLLGGAQ